jgi:16S rRNA (cytosine1402-N4)-methyltransferase
VKRFIDARGGRPEPAANRHLPGTSAAAPAAAALALAVAQGAVPASSSGDRNPRARSARLRAAERLATADGGEAGEPATAAGGGVTWRLAA